MGIRFDALSKLEKAAVADHVREEYDKLIFQRPNDYVARNAQADPQGWQHGLCELIASDAERVKEITSEVQRKLEDSSNGFTLIELSIVLAIIGLIVGGVLVGQSLIGAAAARAQITQIEKYNTAVNSFKGKYGYLPGDIKDPDASTFGFQPRGTALGEGDGNGVIEGVCSGINYGYAVTTGETATFWEDLSAARLIEGPFSTASSSTPPLSNTAGVGLNLYIPPAKLGSNVSVIVDSLQGVNYFQIEAVSLLDLCYAYVDNNNGQGGIPVAVAAGIDQKIDDGLPGSGRVRGTLQEVGIFWSAGAWNLDSASQGVPTCAPVAASPSTCMDNANNTSNAWEYSLSQSGGANPNCALSFQFQ